MPTQQQYSRMRLHAAKDDLHKEQHAHIRCHMQRDWKSQRTIAHLDKPALVQAMALQQPSTGRYTPLLPEFAVGDGGPTTGMLRAHIC